VLPAFADRILPVDTAVARRAAALHARLIRALSAAPTTSVARR
jgi:predicted nucleic acid-binding protein